MTQLARLQEWVPSGCEAVLGPHMSALVDWVDSKIVELAIKARANELPVPSLIERSILERAGYFESFPDNTLEQSEEGLHASGSLLSLLRETRRLQQPSVWTCVARCRRNEDNKEPGRLRAFTMREIVFVGSAAWVRNGGRIGWIAYWRSRDRFGLPCNSRWRLILSSLAVKLGAGSYCSKLRA